jgi:thioredoxin-like negative regulator of GroEL
MGQVVPVKLNVDHAAAGAIAKKYSVNTIPAIFVMNADGKPYGSFIGFKPPADFVRTVSNYFPRK